MSAKASISASIVISARSVISKKTYLSRTAISAKVTISANAMIFKDDGFGKNDDSGKNDDFGTDDDFGKDNGFGKNYDFGKNDKFGKTWVSANCRIRQRRQIRQTVHPEARRHCWQNVDARNMEMSSEGCFGKTRSQIKCKIGKTWISANLWPWQDERMWARPDSCRDWISGQLWRFNASVSDTEKVRAVRPRQNPAKITVSATTAIFGKTDYCGESRVQQSE